jgi:hypothetical protein
MTIVVRGDPNMAVTVNWKDEHKSALVLTFNAPWTWDDFERVDADIEHAFHSVTHTVDLVIDLHNAGPLPDDIFYRMRDAYADATDNIGQYVFLGAPDDFGETMAVVDRYYTALGGRLEFRFDEPGS